MTYAYAKALVGAQERNIKKVNGVRFTYKGYEFRVKYMGGFAAYVGIDYREVGTRNFKYFGGVGGYKYWTAQAVLDAVMEEIIKKLGE